MSKARESFLIVHLSDIHCGDTRFDKKLMTSTLKEINEMKPNLVVIAGDLTASGYREQFVEAREYIEEIQCPHMVVIAGNHDCRNVGFLHFEELIGPRNKILTFNFGVCCGEMLQERVKIVAADSNKADLNDGEIGRHKYQWIQNEFSEENDYKIFILHHHLVSVPGTGRERNIVWDAGDVLSVLRQTGVDLVLCGHKHVPYIWPVANTLIIKSGTVSTWRTRGYTRPAYNTIEIKPEQIDVFIKTLGEDKDTKHTFPRKRKILA